MDHLKRRLSVSGQYQVGSRELLVGTIICNFDLAPAWKFRLRNFPWLERRFVIVVVAKQSLKVALARGLVRRNLQRIIEPHGSLVALSRALGAAKTDGVRGQKWRNRAVRA